MNNILRPQIAFPSYTEQQLMQASHHLGGTAPNVIFY